MPCTLGRAQLPSPDSIRQEGGGRLRIGHSGYPFEGYEGLIMAQQVLGYPNPDEEVVFFTYDAEKADGVLDGAYFVAGTDVDWVKLAAGMFSWSAELIPVPAMQLPTFEVSCLGNERANLHPDPNPHSWVGFPGAALSRNTTKPDSGTASLVGGGTVDVFFDALAGDGTFEDTTVSYAIEPGDVYEAAAQLTVEGAVVTGRQTPRTSLGWVVSNGLVRVRPSLTEANHFVVGIVDSTGATYQEYAYRVGFYAAEPYEYGYDGTDRHGPAGIVVLRNSPECVSIRVVYPDHDSRQFDAGGTQAVSSGYLDVTLRRGQTYADCAFGLDGGSALSLGVWRSVTDPAVVITDLGGVEDATAVGGIKWQIYTPEERTLDATNGGLRTTTAISDLEALQFGIGNDRDVLGSGLTLDDFYFQAQEHFQQAAAR